MPCPKQILPRRNFRSVCRRKCAVQVVCRRVRFVARLLNTFRESRHPFILIFGWCGKQKHITSTIRIMVQFAWRERVIAVNVILVNFYSAAKKISVIIKWTNFILVQHSPLAFVGSWRSEHVPQWLRTHFASRRHVVANLNKFVSFEDGVTRSQVVLVSERHVEILFVGSAGFAFTSIEQLKYSWNFFGICSDYITLGYWADVEHFAVE